MESNFNNSDSFDFNLDDTIDIVDSEIIDLKNINFEDIKIDIENIKSVIKREIPYLDDNEKNDYIRTLSYVLLVETIFQNKTLKFQGNLIKNIHPSCMLFNHMNFNFFQTVCFKLYNEGIIKNNNLIPDNFLVVSEIYKTNGEKFDFSNIKFDEKSLNLILNNYHKLITNLLDSSVSNLLNYVGKYVFIPSKRHRYQVHLDYSLMKLYILTKNGREYLALKNKKISVK